jgi:hypothetical protein
VVCIEGLEIVPITRGPVLPCMAAASTAAAATSLLAPTLPNTLLADVILQNTLAFLRARHARTHARSTVIRTSSGILTYNTYIYMNGAACYNRLTSPLILPHPSFISFPA